MMRETDTRVSKLHDDLNDPERSEGPQTGNIVLEIRASEKLQARVQSFIDLGTTYSLEEAMGILWIHHEECIMAKYDADSKKQIKDRVNCILSNAQDTVDSVRMLGRQHCSTKYGISKVKQACQNIQRRLKLA